MRTCDGQFDQVHIMAIPRGGLGDQHRFRINSQWPYFRVCMVMHFLSNLDVWRASEWQAQMRTASFSWCRACFIGCVHMAYPLSCRLFCLNRFECATFFVCSEVFATPMRRCVSRRLCSLFVLSSCAVKCFARSLCSLRVQ